MTPGELIGLHAEVMSLCETLGISYKDACHRLYMAECDTLKTDDRTQKAFSILTQCTCTALGSFQEQLGQLRHQGNPMSHTDNTDAYADADANVCVPIVSVK